MKLQTRILVISELLRFGVPVLVLVLLQLHWLGLIVVAIWLRFCRPVLRNVLLPPLFPYAQCPGCKYRIPLTQIWGCEGGHYNDFRAQHVLKFHCNEGHEIKSFQCPKANCPKTTIQIQKRIDSKVKKATILGNAFGLAPSELQPNLLRRVLLSIGFWKQQPEKLKLPLGYDRQTFDSYLRRCLLRLLRLPIRKQIFVPESVYGRHMTIFGKSGMGKSKLILGLAQWIFENGMGGTFIDKAGDLANEIIRLVPEDRQDDVLWIRLADRQCPFQFNILEAHDEDEEIDLNEELLLALQRMSQSWGESIVFQIEMGVETARAVGGSLKDVYNLFTNSRTRDRILSQIDDLELLEFWDKYERQADRSTAPAKRKLRHLVKHKRLGPMLSAAKSNFDAEAIIRDSKIVVVDLSTGSASQQVNIVLGTFIIGKIRAAAFRQQFKKEKERVRHWLVVDEAKNFMHKGIDFEKIFSEARKFKLSLVLANQNVGQMNDDVKNEAFGNAGVLLTFNVDNTDAKPFAERMPNISVDDITSQGVGECVAKIHNQTYLVKTELPTIPEYDPTPHIQARMHAINQEVDMTSSFNDETDISSPVRQHVKNLVTVCDGVK